jgi:hypothetical protein
MQYVHDEGKREFQLRDLEMASAKAGIAVGALLDGNGARKPAAVATSDGGAHWASVKLEEMPVSLFFLNESVGWMVTEKGLWKTEEGGRDWKKLPKLPEAAFRVHFVDENTGWAACAKKTVLATHDGGRKWERVAASAEPPGAPERSAYSWIVFADRKVGTIYGFNQPVERWGGRYPEWMDPEMLVKRRETPHILFTLVTRDGGETWRPQSASLFGQVTRARFSAEGPGLGLIEHADSAAFPSEVYALDWRTGKSHVIFHDKRYFITDVWLTKEGAVYLAGIETAGQARSLVPGNVVVFRSSDMTQWTQMAVDYRALGHRAMLAASGQDLWLAVDSGMILKLE